MSHVEQRIRYAGIIFYIVLIGSLLSTDSGMMWFQSFRTNVDLLQAVPALIGLSAAVFTFEPIGFVFNSIYVSIWNLKGGRRADFGGYSVEWSKLTYDLKQEVIKRFEATTHLEISKPATQSSKECLTEYSPDVFLSYFWQQAPRPLVDWVSRRHSVFFIGMTNIVAITSAIAISMFLILIFRMGLTFVTLATFLAFILLAAVFRYNGQGARIEGLHMVDLWMLAAFDPYVGKAVRNIMSLFSSSAEREKTRSLEPLYKVMRMNDVKKRQKTENDLRWYYFDSDLDIVLTKISKRHSEPSHLHTFNTESYYVMDGKLLVNVDGQDIWLNEGDLIVVKPGVCHHFETTSEKVVFLAIKKEPGLEDKKPCKTRKRENRGDQWHGGKDSLAKNQLG